MTKLLKALSYVFLVIGMLAFTFFLGKAAQDGYAVFSSADTDYVVTGQFGDFVGGVVGTLFALAGTLLIFLTFQEQAKENKIRRFESSFFEMIRLHRENVSEMKYRKFKDSDYVEYENRQVVRIIFDEFVECYREVKKFSNSTDLNDYVSPKYQNVLHGIRLRTNPKINPIEMARIDIAYSVVFYGLGVEGESVVRHLFLSKYNPDYYFKLLFFLKLKPKKSNAQRYVKWKSARDLDLAGLRSLVDELYENRKNPKNTQGLSVQAKDFKLHLPYEKYYGGHQFRLGHYFRHLFQSFTYLNDTEAVADGEKYFYGKMLRAQLSTYEQALLLVSSISSLGLKWELSAEHAKRKGARADLITKFGLVKNLPGKHLFGIKYKTYYKGVAFEVDDGTV